MNHQSKKGLGSISVAMIMAVLLVSAGTVYIFASNVLGATRTVTETVTSIAAPSSIELHKVTFNETGGTCSGGYVVYINSWAVTLGNATIGQPSNATLPISGAESASGAYKMISTIVFTVPDGRYNYNVSASLFNAPVSGTVNVHGSDVVVQLNGPEITCYGP